jgi:hypothetical protein
VLGALARHAADVLHAPGERVTLSLKLRQAEQARPAKGLAADIARGVGRDVRKAARDEQRQLALQARDLCAQRTPRGALVDRLDGRCTAVDRQQLGLAHAPTPPRNAGRADSTSAAPAHVTLDERLGEASRAPTQVACSEEPQIHSASSANSSGTPATCTANSASRRVRARGT